MLLILNIDFISELAKNNYNKAQSHKYCFKLDLV